MSETAEAAVRRVAEGALADEPDQSALPVTSFLLERSGIGGPEHLAFGRALDRWIAERVVERELAPGGVVAVLVDLAAGIAVVTGKDRDAFVRMCGEIFDAERAVRAAKAEK